MVSGLLDQAGQRRAEGWEGTCGTGWVVVRFDAGTGGAYSTDASNFPGAASASAPSLPRMNCTLGGMIGNNSCGAGAQRTGKVVDNVAALEVLLYDGTRFWCGPTGDEEYARIGRRRDHRVEIHRRLRRPPGLPLNLVDWTGAPGRTLAVLP
jgi:hypothetical protein